MKTIKNQNGAALVYVILVMVVGIVMIAGMAATSLSESKQSIYQTDNMKAYYIARAGADSMAGYIKNLKSDYWNTLSTLHTTNINSINGGEFYVKAWRDGSFFKIESTGEYGNVNGIIDGSNSVIQKVNATLKYNPGSPGKYAVYSEETIDPMQPGALDWYVASGGDIIWGGGTDSLQHWGVPGAEDSPSAKTIDFDNEIIGSTSLIWTGGLAEITASGRYDNLDVAQTDTLTIDTTAAEYYKTTDDSVIPNVTNFSTVIDGSDKWMIVWIDNPSKISGNLVITGTENLVLIVEDALDIPGTITYVEDALDSNGIYVEIHVVDDTSDDESSPFSDDLSISSPQDTIGVVNKPSKLNIYLSEGSTFVLDVNADFYGYINGLGATVHFQNPSTILYGSVYATEITVQAGVQIYFPEDDKERPTFDIIEFLYWE